MDLNSLPKETVSEVLNIIDKEQSGNPQEKYKPGSIRAFKDSKPYIESAINDANANIMKYFDKVEKNKEHEKATFNPNQKDYPKGYLGKRN